MTCREFIKKLEGFRLAELSSAADTELLAHQKGCASCAALLQQRYTMAGAMQVLRSGTAGLQAPVGVEHAVLRAFRQSAAVQPAVIRSESAVRWSDLFGWKAYAAAATVLAICLGLGLWFAQHSDKGTQQPTAKSEQPAQPSVLHTGDKAQLPVRASASTSDKLISGTNGSASRRPSVVTSTLTQAEQAQGYTPLMLCDPISCSGEEAVVRMELPATAAVGSAGSQMADVIVGDDGLVRAIRIVQE